MLCNTPTMASSWYQVQVLLRRWVALDAPAILGALRAWRADVTPVSSTVSELVIENATGRPGELLADTVGLAELGLPDLQIAFTDRDPAEITLRLRLLVRGMFAGERLDCSWIEETAFVPPARDALTLQLE